MKSSAMFTDSARRNVERAMMVIESEAYNIECSIEFARGVAWVIGRLFAITGLERPKVRP